MALLFVPPLRTRFLLLEDWTFDLYSEYRNRALIDHFGYPYSTGGARSSVKATLPAGTVLSIDRYYIKNGASEYDSVTFRASFDGVKASKRFWAKLADVNRLNVEFENVVQ